MKIVWRRFFCLWLSAACGVGASGADDGDGLTFSQRVAKALRRGRVFLGGLCEAADALPDYGYPMGARALFAAALVSAGRSSQKNDVLKDPVVNRLFESIRPLPMKRTYSPAMYVIAMDCLYKAVERRYGPRRARAFLAGRFRTDLEKCINWLVRAQSRKSGGWSYMPLRTGSRFDLSNTQFAVLALGIGARHGVAVPPDSVDRLVQVSLSCLKTTAESHKAAVTRHLDLNKPKQGPLVSVLSDRPGGWGYSLLNDEPYFAMTAATLGNLFVARELRMTDRRLALQMEPAINQGLLWLDRRWKDLDRQRKWLGSLLTKNYFYTVWSLEKAFDLGGIAVLGGKDWYREEAGFLVGIQNEDGSWSQGKLQPVATAFALLFLSRASAVQPVLSSAPSLFTGPGAASNPDRVYIPDLKGHLSASVFLDFLRETGNGKLLGIAEQVVTGYAPDLRTQLVLPLKALLTHDSRRIRDFAAGHLRTITGENRVTDASMADWWRIHQAIAAAASAGKPEDLKPLIPTDLSGVLFDRLLRAAEKLGASVLVPDLIAIFEKRDKLEKPRLHRALCYLTGRREPYREAAGALAYWRSYLRSLR